MKAEKEHIDELIVSYLSNELDGNAVHELKEWIAASVENEKYFMQRQEIWFSAISVKEDVKYDKSKAFEQFKNRIANQRLNDKRERENFCLSKFWRYAAVIVILFSVSYFSYWRGGISIKEVFSDIIVEAPLGSRTKLTLPDGTLVWLNAASRITLGTKFNFRDYPDDAEAIVSLSEGKVALNNLLKKEKEAFLLPNERVVLNKKNGRMHVEYSTVSNALQWTNGYLFFDEELLPDVVKELERSYNVKIQIASDTLNTFRFYGNFVHREQNIQEVLEALSATRKIHYFIEGHNITLY